ncbi:hypothetical protein LCM4579_17950 [Ensifer sp. LCM 4579]|nr:hypothetical protein LCM4579_17950 [Ensifer sp. LCM 4579]
MTYLQIEQAGTASARHGVATGEIDERRDTVTRRSTFFERSATAVSQARAWPQTRAFYGSGSIDITRSRT